MAWGALNKKRDSKGEAIDTQGKGVGERRPKEWIQKASHSTQEKGLGGTVAKRGSPKGEQQVPKRRVGERWPLRKHFQRLNLTPARPLESL